MSRTAKPHKSEPFKSLWNFYPQHLKSAEETIQEAERHQAHAQQQTEQLQGNLYAWGRWLGVLRALGAHVPTVVRPSVLDEITPFHGELTIKGQAIKPDVQADSLEAQHREEIARKKTQPLKQEDALAGTFYSIRREIWSQADTQEHNVVRPRLAVQDDPSKQSGNLRKRA